MSEENWQCTICKATVRVDAEALTFHALYPVDSGPYAALQPRPHSCPVRLGLFPEKLEEHPNAIKVS